MQNSPIRTCANYNVGLKVLLRKGEEVLVLKSQTGRHIDLPGGRIDTVEHHVSLSEIIDREIKEELGDGVQYRLGIPLFQFRRHFDEKDLHVFLTVYSAEYLSGDICISPEHSAYEWVNIQQFSFPDEMYFDPEEQVAFRTYFSKR